MSVFLLLLKIIGILLLSLLGLVLLIVLLVLFCPISYGAKGSCKKGQTDVHTKITWLIGLLAVCVDITDEKVKSYIRVCGIRISFSHKRDNLDDFEDTREGEYAVSDDSPTEEKPLAAQELQWENDEMEQETSLDNDVGASSQSVFSKIQNVWLKGKETLQSLKDFFTHGKETYSKILSLWENESCKAGIKYIIQQLLSFLGKLRPKKFCLKLSFSTGSPDTTGEILGVLSVFPIAYRYRWEIMPDFVSEEAYADAVFDISGKLFGFQILRTVLAIILDKNCRKLYNKLMK